MNRTSAPLRPDVGPFLYASVGEEGDGMLLSVLSAIARRNLDPWQEAAVLAALPVAAARTRLASILAGQPGMTARLDVGETANRLMALLPKRLDAAVPSSMLPLEIRRMAKSSFITWIITMGVILGLQAFAVSKQVAQAPVTAATVMEPLTPGGPH